MRDDSAGTLAERIVGTWWLTSRIDRAADGSVRDDPALGSDPLAILTYTRQKFAAQFMKRDRSTPLPLAASGSGRNNTSAIGGYDAYFGRYEVQADGTVLHRLEAALTPSNVGIEVARRLSVDDDHLTIELETATQDGVPIVRTLVWERLE